MTPLTILIILLAPFLKKDKKEKSQKCETKQQEAVPTSHLKDVVELVKEIKKND